MASSIRRDGANSTTRMIEALRASQFRKHVQAVLLQGIAVGGFFVVVVCPILIAIVCCCCMKSAHDAGVKAATSKV